MRDVKMKKRNTTFIIIRQLAKVFLIIATKKGLVCTRPFQFDNFIALFLHNNFLKVL